MNLSPKACVAFELVASSIGSVFLLDGGTGEELFARGVPDDRKIWSASAVVHAEYHDVLQEVHRSFLNAGAQAITTNSYGIVPGVGFSELEIPKYCATAGRLARQIVTDFVAKQDDQSATDSTAPLVFGSLGPLVESYRPDKVLERCKGVDVYSKMVAALAPFVDAFLAETLSSTEEAMQVVEAVSSTMGDECLPTIVSFSLNAAGRLRSDDSVIEAIPRILDCCQQRGVKLLALCFNCCEPTAITSALEAIRSDVILSRRLSSMNVLLGAYANRLTTIADDWTLADSQGPQAMREDLAPELYFTEYVAVWVKELNVKVVGGCCGITPNHIAYIKKHLS